MHLVAAAAFLLAASANPVASSPLASRQQGPSASNITVTVRNGTARGSLLPGLNVHQFLGLPYAQTTGGQGRFARPRSLNTSFTGVFDATVPGNVCPGYGISSYANPAYNQFYNISEDCLNINVWRPANVSANASLPVLFWIFGGAFTQGTGADPRYNGSYIVQKSVQMGTPIIFVNINYRVSAFGFPAGQAANSSGNLNLGLRDQRLALGWVQENIAAFGGDAKAVSIWGQSAGGQSVVLQNLAFGGRDDGLFRSSIVDSGVFLTQVNTTLANRQASWNTFLSNTNCTDDLACLRRLDFNTIYTAANGTPPALVPDGDFIQSDYISLMKQNKFVKLPMIIGSNKDEGTSGIGTPVGIQNDTQFVAAAQGAFSAITLTSSSLTQLQAVFPNNISQGCPFDTGNLTLPTGAQDKRINWLYTEGINAGTRYFARQRAALGLPTYRYHFTQVPQNGTAELGVSHFYEIPFAFGIMNQTVRNPMSQRPADITLTSQYQSYIINFVNTGNPNNGSGTNATMWPSYGSNSQALQLQDNNTVVITDNFRNASAEFVINLATSVV